MRGLLSTVRRYLTVAGQLARIGVRRKSQFRVEFFSQVVMDCFWYTIHVTVFEILLLHADDIAGWRHEDIRVFIGFLFVSDAFMMMWLGQQWRFGRDLKDGKLDPFRVRPVAPSFLYFFQQFSLEAVFNIIAAVGYLTYGLIRADLEWGPGRFLLIAWAIVIAFWARTVLTILFSILEFHLLNSDLARSLEHAFGATADRPLDIFARRVKLFLLHAVPMGFLSHWPAALVLGRREPWLALLDTTWMLLFGVLTFQAWKLSFRRYESAMG
ncbi:MAG: ABC-2 family transporter protein [Acidobacteriota bacterium]